MDQSGKVNNPGRGQLNRKHYIPLFPSVPEHLVSRDGFSRSVPRQAAHLHTHAESDAYSRDSSRFPRRRPFPDRLPPSGRSRVNRVTQLRTEGVPCRESTSTGPVTLEVVPVTGATFLGFTLDQCLCTSLFPHQQIFV